MKETISTIKDYMIRYWWATMGVIALLSVWVLSPLIATKNVAISTMSADTALTKQLVKGENTTKKTITMVYKDDCPYCEHARKVITEQLSAHNDDVVQFSQIDYQTTEGKALLKKFNAKGVPLIVVTNTDTNVSHAFNDDDTKGIETLLHKYAFNDKD